MTHTQDNHQLNNIVLNLNIYNSLKYNMIHYIKFIHVYHINISILTDCQYIYLLRYTTMNLQKHETFTNINFGV